jgi:glycosyltransferase involved in cell wall biosynthesis
MVEIEWMIRLGVKVCIIPYKSHGPKRSLPPEVTIFNPSVTRNQLFIRTFKLLFVEWFLKEICLRPDLFFRKETRQSVLFFLKMMTITQFRLESFYASHPIFSDDIIYSYWFSGLTGGAIRFRENLVSQVKVISRAHGGDLYEYRYLSNYLPFREYLLSRVDYLALISKNGWEYLSKKYPAYSGKMAVHYLGINDPGFLCEKSTDAIIRIVSCSYISPVKRIPFLIDVLKYVSDKHPLVKLKWSHIGGGEGLSKVKKYAEQHLSSATIHWTFLGDLPNEDVIKFYQVNPVDVFVSVSSSEGIPVSMMEAMSVGIPVVSTNVGGVIELVGENRVINANTSVASFAEFLISQLSKPSDRMEIKSLWAQGFDASKGYMDFLKKIL